MSSSPTWRHTRNAPQPQWDESAPGIPSFVPPRTRGIPLHHASLCSRDPRQHPHSRAGVTESSCPTLASDPRKELRWPCHRRETCTDAPAQKSRTHPPQEAAHTLVSMLSHTAPS